MIKQCKLCGILFTTLYDNDISCSECKQLQHESDGGDASYE